MINLLPINKGLTTTNYTKGNNRVIKFICLHYTANNGDTAKNNIDYFRTTDRGASAHYFVDESAIWQCVDDQDIAWSVGGGYSGKYFGICTNQNSINIEMCSEHNGVEYYINQETINNAVELTKYLMAKYNIPISNVITHHLVNGKICPAPFVNHPEQWTAFKTKLTASSAQTTPNTRQYYRVATSYTNGKYINQRGAFAILNNAKRCCDSYSGTYVFDPNGDKIYPATFQNYLVVVDTDVLNVRLGPSTDYPIVTQVRYNEVYTIVGELSNWGKLKSGAGYICLDYTRRL